MRFQVPQFIDIEDRIVGPLTLKMFGFYAIAGMVLVPLYVLLDLSLFITLALPIIGIAALFAHVRLHGQSFAAVLSHALTFFVSPRIYLWRRGGSPYPMILRGEEYADYTTAFDTSSSLRALAQMLNSHGNVSALDAADPMMTESAPEAPLPGNEVPPVSLQGSDNAPSAKAGGQSTVN